MTSLRLFLAVALGLTGCSTVSPPPAAPVETAVPTDMSVLSAAVDSWDGGTRAEVRDATLVLLTNCPYNRSAFQVPYVLQHVIGTIPIDTLPTEVRADWSAMTAHLDAYVALLERIAGPELVPPGITDYNFELAHGSTPSRAELLADPDPIARTALLQSQIHDRVRSMPPAVYARVSDATNILYEQTENSWPPSWLLEPTRRTLEQAARASTDAPQKQQLNALLDLIKVHEQQGC